MKCPWAQACRLPWAHVLLPDLSAPVNGEATSQKESTVDKEAEGEPHLEEGPGCGSSEDLHNK